ncbi:hypothetical protein Tco_0830355 [Tanacetum coccineum]
MADQDTPPPTITAMKIPIIKKGEYDIWSMRMRQYICHTDHNLWDIIVNGDLEDEATPSGEQSSPPVPKTAKQLAARRNQERIKSILLLAIPDEYLLKFHNVPDAKSLWAAIKSRFGGNEESKKMQKNVLKHQFENFVTASNETLDKAYDRFQKLISQLEIHGAYVSKEDINQKFLRSLPPSWSQIALIMRNKPDIDEIDIDDLYNNLRVYEDEMKKSSTFSSNTQNLAFLSSENTNSTNELTFLSCTTNNQVLNLRNKDFQQMDGDDLEELDLRCQRLSATTVIEKDILLENVDLEGVKEEDLMVTMAGAMHKQLNLHIRLWSRWAIQRSYYEDFNGGFVAFGRWSDPKDGAAVDQGEGSAQPAEPHHTPVNPISSTSQPPIPSPHPSPPPHSPHQSPLQSPPHSPLQSSPHPSPPHPSPPHPSPLHQSPPHSPPHSPPPSPPHFSPPRSYEAPLPEGNTSGSVEDSMCNIR